MKTWKIHEVANACFLTTDEISKWISRGDYRPSQDTRRGEYRRFDWRDVACLAVMAALRPHCMTVNMMGLMAGDLRDHLAEIEDIPEKPDLYFFDALWSQEKYHGTCGLVSKSGLADVFRHSLRSCFVVNVSAVYHEAMARLASNES